MRRLKVRERIALPLIFLCGALLAPATAVNVTGFPAIRAHRISPTTDLLVFAPSEWPLQQGKGGSVEHLMLAQRTCALSHFRFETCISKDFNVQDSETELNQFSLIRADPQSQSCTTTETGLGFMEWAPGIAEPMEVNTADTSDAKCRWVPDGQTSQFMRMRTNGDDGGPLPVTATVSSAQYAAEVCLTKRGCDPSTFICTNTYAAASLASRVVFDVSDPQTNLAAGHSGFPMAFSPFVQPLHGSGDIGEVLRMDPEGGPFRPCPVTTGGRQLPCSEESLELASGSFAAVEPLVLHLSNFVLKKVLSLDVSDGSFVVRFKYKVAWSDRYATHPCTISLYPYGKGVPRGDAPLKVNASDWWVPEPGGDVPSSVSYTPAKKLSVLKAPGSPVVAPCRATVGSWVSEGDDCPWPMQLFLQDEVSVVARYTQGFDLGKFPFDRHLLRAELKLAENFATDDTEYTLVASGIADGEVLEVASDLFSGQDYVVDGVSFRVSGGSVVAEVRVYRDNTGMKFVRAVFPMIMNAGLVGFAGSTKGHARVKYLALSLLAAIFMLDGAKLGLPPGLGGVPFVMSLVIVHIVIAAAVLAISIVEAENNYRLQKKVMKGGKWKEVIAARTRWEHANALLAPHRKKAFAAAGIELDPAHWPAQLGSGRDPPGSGKASGVKVQVDSTSSKAEKEVELTSPPAGVQERGLTRESSALAAALDRVGASPQPLKPAGPEVISVDATPSVSSAALDKLDSMLSLMAVLPEMMARASSEPITPFEPDAYKNDARRAAKLESILHYFIFPMYVLLWAILASVYFGQPDPW